MTLDGQKVSFGPVHEYQTQMSDGRIRFITPCHSKAPLPLADHSLDLLSLTLPTM